MLKKPSKQISSSILSMTQEKEMKNCLMDALSDVLVVKSELKRFWGKFYDDSNDNLYSEKEFRNNGKKFLVKCINILKNLRTDSIFSKYQIKNNEDLIETYEKLVQYIENDIIKIRKYFGFAENEIN